MYKLYVIPGSHACRSAILMLEHKGIPYRRIEFVTLTHPVAARLSGFNSGGETRAARGKRTAGIRLDDMLATVPGLSADGERISTSRQIARFLDRRHLDPPLFAADPAQRVAVEEAESWANEAHGRRPASRSAPGAARSDRRVDRGRSTRRRAAECGGLHDRPEPRADALPARHASAVRRPPPRWRWSTGCCPSRNAAPPD
ncbi:MAG TPA: hypothetical protein VMD48_09895 [Solirubrobacteraceae bacterium]|nr:hypothetical protein [Solirubrobacteraceae bacterium]